jgi:ATP-dependent DNA helicase HFM1/MER3
VKTQHGVKIRIKAEIGFMNEKPPHRFGERFIYVCVLVETSDGRMIHFARIRSALSSLTCNCAVLTHASGSKLGTGQSIVFPAQLISLNQSINCYTMCDGIGA